MHYALAAVSILLSAACTTGRAVALSELWEASAGGGGAVETEGAIEWPADAACDGATLVDGATRVRLTLTDGLCRSARAAGVRRVRVRATVSVSAAMPDLRLRPDAGGCEPLLVLHAERIDAVR